MIEFYIRASERGGRVRVRAVVEEDVLWVGAEAIRLGWAAPGGALRICLPGDTGARRLDRRRGGRRYRRAVDLLVERVGERTILALRNE